MVKRFTKSISLLALLLLLTFSALTGCGTSDEPKKEETKTEQGDAKQGAFPVTIKDSTGKDITIEKKPEKIVSLLPSITENLFALGLDKEIVGVSDYDNYPEAATKKEKVGSQDMNLEKILALKPDVAFLQEYHVQNHANAVKQLEDAGITVVVPDGTQASFEDAYDVMQLLAKATGKEKEADKIIADMKEKVAAIKEQAKNVKEKKKVYVEVSPAPDIFTTGKNTFMNEMIEMIGAENVAANLDGWVKLSEEEAVKFNPDVIITTYGYYVDKPAEQVLNRKGWAEVNAVKNKQVFDVDSDSTTRPGPRLVDGVEELAKTIYPDVFK
ncbi:ABC transporter substrate-binding protein [Bacillus massiliigorillae]|uniref:ABC transporter substrate-binding protein n=1 Tax=Bacillus massiliigorillae TaxID=1243664 RepID=UPI00039B46D1|nr:ABC transporter substrate-binding protein [Bacillus massiliigorillae]